MEKLNNVEIDLIINLIKSKFENLELYIDDVVNPFSLQSQINVLKKINSKLEILKNENENEN